MGLYLCFVLLDPIPTPIRTPNALYNYLQPLPSPFSPLPQGTKAPRVQQLSFPTWRQISVHRTCGTCAQSMVCAISEPTPQGRAQKCRRAGRSAAATLHNGAVPTSLYIVVTQKLSCKWPSRLIVNPNTYLVQLPFDVALQHPLVLPPKPYNPTTHARNPAVHTDASQRLQAGSWMDRLHLSSNGRSKPARRNQGPPQPPQTTTEI